MKPSLELVSGRTPPHHQPTHCPNCHAVVRGKFCSACGGETEVEVPSAREFLHEFIGHYVALEGKLFKTLQLLMARPGQLTLDFLAGRRVFVIPPLRLYLTLSLVMFALIKIVGIELPQLTIKDDSIGVSYRHVVPERTGTLYVLLTATEDDPAPGTRPAARTDGAKGEAEALPPANAVIKRGIEAVGKVNRKWANNLDEFMREPAKEKTDTLSHGFLAYVPYMLIAALPLFALYLKLIYRRTGRRYGEHLVFALHANAFAFLLASLMILVPGNAAWVALCLYDHLYSLISVWDCLQLIPFLWLVLYLPAAMRRVYGGTRLATAGRWLLLIGAHLLVISILTIAAQLIGILGHG